MVWILLRLFIAAAIRLWHYTAARLIRAYILTCYPPPPQNYLHLKEVTEF